MSDAPPKAYPPDAYLAQLEKLVQTATPGPWEMRARADDGSPAPRIVDADSGAPILTPALPDDDPERIRDIGYDVALAVAAVGALPYLTGAVRGLKADLAEAVGSLLRILAIGEAMHDRLAAIDPDHDPDHSCDRCRDQGRARPGDEVRRGSVEGDGSRGGD